MLIAVYPGRFDPVTNGHVDIAQRTSTLFERVVIAVYDMQRDKCMFSTEERVELFREAVRHLRNVEVKSFTGLVVDFARKEQAKALVRGIRAVTDFEAELDMALMNKKMAPEIESVYMMASLEHLYVSGHRIREVAGLGYDVGELVPPHVGQALEKKLLK
ncbi:MAG TPA: pantetheine-phosphate adenylyltransferase [Dehalococcoidia bacterium]|nr:pantetheine-phosphate adenylyltransferase [Dehalococcoidia bacterium]